MKKSEDVKSDFRALTQSEMQDVANMKARRGPNHDIFRTLKTDGDSKVKVEPAYAKDLSEKDAQAEFNSRVYAATGAASQEVGLNLLSKAYEALSSNSDKLESSVQQLNMIAQAMQALEPRDEAEGQLLAQLVVLHDQAMSWLGRALKTERVDFANTYLNGASKLIARHHETLTALLKYRRGGEQRVHVEHVHVHNGGKAIVGNVGAGGGSNNKNEEGPHAKV